MGSMHMFVLDLLCFMTMLNFVSGNVPSDAGTHVKGTIGVVTEKNSRKGKEEIVAIKMALDDFYHYSNQSFAIQIRNSHGDSLQALLAGFYFSSLSSFYFYIIYAHHTFNSVILIEL